MLGINHHPHRLHFNGRQIDELAANLKLILQEGYLAIADTAVKLLQSNQPVNFDVQMTL
jgi:hypothetical protein